MRALLSFAAICLVTACGQAEEIVEQSLRAETKAIVNDQVAQNFPGVNAAPITDCIIDNASTSEILTIGSAALSGVTSSTTDLVMTIAGRPDTLACISGNGTGLFLL